MLKGITLKTALAVSVSIHLLALSPWNALRFPGPVEEEDQIEVTYILEEVSEEAFEEEIKTLPQKYDLEEKAIEEPREREEEEPAEEYLEEEELEKLEEYISYYELVREKIKQYVTRYYRDRQKKGSVVIAFKAAKTGRLLAVSINESSQSPYLDRLALRAVKSSAPFPPFPEALRKDELTFTISIIFKKE